MTNLRWAKVSRPSPRIRYSQVVGRMYLEASLIAPFIVRYLSGPRSLLVAAWVSIGLTGGAVGIAALFRLVVLL